jgi:hypothetical protein
MRFQDKPQNRERRDIAARKNYKIAIIELGAPEMITQSSAVDRG